METQSALDHLTQPSLLPSFSSEILSVLLTHSKDPNLPLAYYHSVSPPIPVGSEVREHYFQFLASLSVTQAFFFSRSQPDRRQLFESLVSIGLHEKRKPDQGDQALALIDLPLDAEEEAWWKEFLTKKGERKGKDKKEAELARAMLYMRSITTGRGSDLLGVEGSLGGKRIGGVDWDTIRSGIAKATGPRSGMLGAK